MTLFCQGCGRFVSSRHATCRSCGREHDRFNPASEDPPRWRNHAKARHVVLARRRRYRR